MECCLAIRSQYIVLYMRICVYWPPALNTLFRIAGILCECNRFLNSRSGNKWSAVCSAGVVAESTDIQALVEDKSDVHCGLWYLVRQASCTLVHMWISDIALTTNSDQAKYESVAVGCLHLSLISPHHLVRRVFAVYGSKKMSHFVYRYLVLVLCPPGGDYAM